MASKSVVNAFEPADSQSVGNLPSAELGSDVGSSASAVSTDESDSAGGRFGGASPPRGGAPIGAGAGPPGDPEGTPSSLDTVDTSCPVRQRCVVAEETWLDEMDWLTQDWRTRRAREFEKIASERVAKAIATGENESAAQEYGIWHRQRAKGHEMRFERVRACGVETLEIQCDGCGRTHELEARCRLAVVCLTCRGTIAAKKRAVMLAARKNLITGARRDGLFKEDRRGGRWSEKLMTLTTPHVSGDTALVRIERLLDAAGRFTKRLRRLWKEQGAKQSAHYLRAVEWTPGRSSETDPAGHPHIHFWVFSPYLDQEKLTNWWRSALLAEGLPVSDETIDVDIREVRNGPNAAKEVIKYLFKDIDHKGRKVPAEVYAEVYKGFDGRRLTQASKGFLSMAGEYAGCECGATLEMRKRKREQREANAHALVEDAEREFQKELTLPDDEAGPS